MVQAGILRRTVIKESRLCFVEVSRKFLNLSLVHQRFLGVSLASARKKPAKFAGWLLYRIRTNVSSILFSSFTHTGK